MRRSEYEAVTKTSRSGAGRELSELEALGLIAMVGTTGRWAYCILKTTQITPKLPKNNPEGGNLPNSRTSKSEQVT